MKALKTLGTIIVALLVVITISCKKKDTIPSTPTGVLLLHLHTDVDTNEVDSLGLPYHVTGGRTIIVDTAQLYVSNIQLIGNSSSAYSVANKVIFKIQPVEQYTVGNVPVGQYQSVKFDIGLDSVTNAVVPNASDTALDQPTMYLNGGSSPQPGGYTFIYFSGYIDTTAAMTGSWYSALDHTGFAKFSYKIGTNKNLATITMPSQPYTIVSGAVQEVHMIIDYYKLCFTGSNGVINISNSTVLTINSSNENSAAAKQVVQNIQPNVGIRYEY